jgi:hypothetical protein
MLGGLLTRWDKRVSRLLDAVVQEAVGPLMPEHQPGPHRLPKRRVQRRLGPAVDHAQRGGRRIAEAGELLQRSLGLDGQAAELAEHQLHHIVGEARGLDAIEVPGPARLAMIEGEQSLLGQRGEELDGEEGIAAGLFVHQPGQRLGAVPLAMQGIGDEPAYVLKPERRQQDILHRRARMADRRQPPHERVRWCDLVVAVGADQEQVMHIRLRQHMLEQVERRRIEPLQIVEEQRQRMLRPGKHAEKAPEHELEAALRVLRR